MLLRMCGSSGETLQEFLIKKTTESARLGRRGVIFHLSVETILVKFDDEEKAKKFSQMVAEIRSVPGLIFPSPA